MKIAIHYIEGVPGGFNAGWIEACRVLGVDFKVVNAYDTDIIEQVRECDAFMWHWGPNDSQLARQLIASLEALRIKVFPDIATCWHFDDKIAQKYLFEALGVPTPASWVFYDKAKAIEWAKKATYPKVFKLRGGAGAVNVRLVKSFSEAMRLIKKAFGTGFARVTGFADFRTKLKNHKRKRDWRRVITQTLPKVLWSAVKQWRLPKEGGYVYFQEFIPNNSFDIRVVVIGRRAFAIRRNCRPNDFRASGSGEIVYNKGNIPIECVRIAFDSAKKMNVQSAAFDFVRTHDNQYLIVEVSYGFAPRAYDECDGFWTDDLAWHDERVLFEKWMVEELLN